MRKWMVCLICICFMITIAGCTKQEEEVLPPTYTALETVTMYMDAMKQQDGVLMSEYTISGTGDNFAISDHDAEAMGLNATSAKTMMDALFSFTYTSEDKISSDPNQAIIEVSVTTYDVNKVLEATIAQHKTEFTTIQKSKDSETANQEIANILVSAFADAPKEYVDVYTFHVSLIDNVWKIDDTNIADFYRILLNTILA